MPTIFGFSELLLFSSFFVGVSETLQILNQMIFVPLKYHKELSHMGIISIIKAAIKEDKLSFFLVYSAEYLGIFLLVGTNILGIKIGYLMLPLSAIALGIILIIAGESLRLWATYTLGRSFTYFVVTSRLQKLITKGPYRFVRHPGYSGGLLIILGFGIVTGSLFIAILYTAFLSLAYVYRISVEEKALVNRFGSKYKEYSKSTARIIPYII